MKPPPRKRTKRDCERKEEAPYSRRVLCNWPKVEQVKLLTALKNLSTSQFANQCATRSTKQSKSEYINPSEPTTSQTTSEPTTSQSTSEPTTSQSTSEPTTSPGPLPDLDPELLRKELDTRSTEEINAVLETLKKKIIVFAQNKLRAERRSERSNQKPIDVWTQVASTVTRGSEEALSAAFSQIFLVTSTEPCPVSNGASALIHCPVTTLNKGNPPFSNAPVPPPSPAVGPQFQVPPSHQPGNTLPATGASSQSAANRRLPSPYADEAVSFERIYQYFSVLHKPNQRCKLTPMESAIVLDLLMSLPEELMLLDYNKLSKHLTQMHQYFSYPANSKIAKDFLKDLQLPGEPEPKPNSEFLSHYSPLNPFMIPLSLLKRKAPAEANQT